MTSGTSRGSREVPRAPATSILRWLRQPFKKGKNPEDISDTGGSHAKKKDFFAWSLPSSASFRRPSKGTPPPTLLEARHDTSPLAADGKTSQARCTRLVAGHCEEGRPEAELPAGCLRPKQQVHWASFAEHESEKNVLGPTMQRKNRRTRTVHTWLGAMLDVSEGGLATVDPSSPLPSGRSSRSLRQVQGLQGDSAQSQCSAPTSPASGTLGIIAHLREHFFANVDFDGSGHLSRQDLFDHIRELLEKGNTLTNDDLELLGEVERCRYSEMDLGLEGEGLGVHEWVHFILLRASAPSHVAAKHLNRHLRAALEGNPEFLMRLHTTFEAADWEGDGMLRSESWQQAFEPLGVEVPEEACLDRDRDNGLASALSYYEFLAHALGMKLSVVELALYDLSKGVAQWVPASLLGGHTFDGVWHSGIRVFGKEFWFGGVILESNYCEVPFGVPAKIIRLGATFRSHEDLVEFLKEDVYVDYNPKSYDVLRRNCNHFSNELAQFLLHGQQLPEEVLLQPEWVKDALLVSIFHPALNRWLGGFGDDLAGRDGTDGSEADPFPQAVCRIDDMTEEWRDRLQAGDLVMHRRRFIDRPRVARLLAISGPDECGRRVAKIKFFRPTAIERWEDLSLDAPPWAWEIVQESDIPLRQFYPVLEDSEGGARILKAGLAIRDARARRILQRPRAVAVQPVCAKGHPLRQQQGRWWGGSYASCSVCAQVLHGGSAPLVCVRCNFALCMECRDRALQLPSGGVFTDMLTPELARALLQEEGWLTFKARAYFFRADHHSIGVLDKGKVCRVDARLAAELGVKPLTDNEILKELQRLRPKTPRSKNKALQLSEASFREFFTEELSRSLKLLASGKEWRPCNRKRYKRRERTQRASASEIDAVLHLPKAD